MTGLVSRMPFYEERTHYFHKCSIYFTIYLKKQTAFGVCNSVMLLRDPSWPFKEMNMIKIGRDNAKMVRRISNFRLKEHNEKIYIELTIAIVWSSKKNGRENLAK